MDDVMIDRMVSEPFGDNWGTAIFMVLGSDGKKVATTLTEAVKSFTEGKEVIWRVAPVVEWGKDFAAQTTKFKGRARFAFRYQDVEAA